MAFKDSNGKITIDEIAAQKDIANIDAAVADLIQARDSINEIMYQSQSFSGKTATTIGEVSAQILKEYNELIEKLEITKTVIKNTVAHYEKIDEDLKNTFNNMG
jgi:gas vesicle protein